MGDLDVMDERGRCGPRPLSRIESNPASRKWWKHELGGVSYLELSSPSLSLSLLTNSDFRSTESEPPPETLPPSAFPQPLTRMCRCVKH
jgi:hypothetical protein